MSPLLKPQKLQKGDTVATISISGGRAGDTDILERYQTGKRRLETILGLKVVETPHALCGSEYLYKNPKARAEDLHQALLDPNIKAIIANMGGDDACRLLPFLDYGIIERNSKILLGYSDISTLHMAFAHAGVSSFYGPNLLTPIAQPVELDQYTEKWMRKILFANEVIGPIEPCSAWTEIEWTKTNASVIQWHKSPGYEVLQGKGKVSGRLLGGCGGPLRQIMGACVFPTAEMWKNSIIFLEVLAPYGGNSTLYKLHELRAFAAAGMFRLAQGMICPYLSEEDKDVLLKVIRDEEGLEDFPILINVDFGHRTPMTILPIGALAEIDCDNCTFSILESGVE